jgi:energy-coupling factor transporter transmembrane protein EcfT
MNKWVAMLIWLVVVLIMGFVFATIGQDYYLLPVFIPFMFGIGVAIGWMIWNWEFLGTAPLKENYLKSKKQKKEKA